MERNSSAVTSITCDAGASSTGLKITLNECGGFSF